MCVLQTANELKQLQSQLSESQRKYSDLAAEKTASGEQSTREIERLQSEVGRELSLIGR